MQQKEYLCKEDIFRTLNYINSELIDIGVQRKFDLYSLGGTKLMLEDIKLTSKDMDFVVSREDDRSLSEIVAKVKQEKGIIIDLFKDGIISEYRIPDYQQMAKRVNYYFSRLNLYSLGDLDLVLTKIIAGRDRDFYEVINFLKDKKISKDSLRKRFSEFTLNKNSKEEIIQKFELGLETIL